MESFISNFRFPKNYGRKSVHDNNYCYSLTFGTDRQDFIDNCKDFPELYKLLQEYINKYNEKFEYNIITINKNLMCNPHKDLNNKGESLIIGLGDYEGGELIFHLEDKKFNDIKNKWLKFRGGEITHSVNDFIGNRYTIIYYKY